MQHALTILFVTFLILTVTGWLSARRRRPSENQNNPRTQSTLSRVLWSIPLILLILLRIWLNFGINQPSADTQTAAQMNAQTMKYFNDKQYDLALSKANAATTAYPHDATALAVRGAAYLGKLQVDKAFADAQSALLIDPHHPFALALRATIYLARDQYSASLRDFDEVVRLQPSLAKGVYGFRALDYVGLRQYDKADKDIDAALAIKPDDTVAIDNRSEILLRKKEYNEAIAYLNPFMREDSDHADLFKARGIAKYISVSPAAALEDFATAVRLNMDIPDDMITLWLHIARLRAGEDDHEEFARNSARLLLHEWPEPLILLFEHKITPQDALAKALNPDAEAQAVHMCEAYFYVGQYYLTGGRKDVAKTLFQSADEHCADSIEANAARAELKALEK